jgi:3-methyladenine DNA glycosylase/8-oxoguanine DNA glycosylase
MQNTKAPSGEKAARALIRRVFMSTEILDESPLFRSMMREATSKGKAEGMREAAQAALEGRFGALDTEVLAALNAADAAALKGLMAHLATDTIEQVRARLRQPGSSGA